MEVATSVPNNAYPASFKRSNSKKKKDVQGLKKFIKGKADQHDQERDKGLPRIYAVKFQTLNN